MFVLNSNLYTFEVLKNIRTKRKTMSFDLNSEVLSVHLYNTYYLEDKIILLLFYPMFSYHVFHNNDVE